MEMFYFTLGVLTVVALILIGVVILGMIKVSKHEKNILIIRDQFSRDLENVYRRFDDMNRDFEDKIKEVQLEIGRVNQDCISYTDKRIDKMIYQCKEK